MPIAPPNLTIYRRLEFDITLMVEQYSELSDSQPIMFATGIQNKNGFMWYGKGFNYAFFDGYAWDTLNTYIDDGVGNKNTYSYHNRIPSLNGVYGYQNTRDATYPTTFNQWLSIGVITGNRSFKGRAYESFIYDDRVCVAHSIPCYRKADGIMGMYDIVNNQFYRGRLGNNATSPINDIIRKGADVN